MNVQEVNLRIDSVQAEIAEKEEELSRKANRHKELAARQTVNRAARKRFITRIKLEMKTLEDELAALKTELWGLQELNLPEA